MRQRSKISARAAERLVRGADPVGEQERAVAGVLAALGAEPEPREAPDELVAAFARAQSADHRLDARAGRRSGARTGRIGRAAVAKAAVVLALVSGATFIAAAADALPDPAQQVVHSLFGSWGVPAPHGTVSSTPSPSPGGAGPGASPDATPTDTGRPAKSPASPSSGPDCAATRGHEVDARCSAASGTGASSSPAGRTAQAHPSPGSGNGRGPSAHPGPSLSPADLRR